MKRTLTASAVAAFVLTACTDAPVITEPLAPMNATLSAGASDIIPGHFIVTLRSGVEPGAMAQAHGVTPQFVYGHAINGFAGAISEAARTGLLRDARVLRIEPDQIVRKVATQTISGGHPWGLDRIDQRDRPLSGSYTYNPTGSGVTVYILDTGVRFDHQEFEGRASSGYDFIDNDANASDCDGHGTHVAGTVGGKTFGVAKSVQLKSVRVLNCSGSGTWSGVIAGINWVTANAAKPAVANMSLGGGASASVDDAVRNSIAAGVLYALAAGNGNMAGRPEDACTRSPARVTQGLTVGASSSTDTEASWSNYGTCVDLLAPGVSIRSSTMTSTTSFENWSGTSMATPHVAGVAALYLQDSPSASAADVHAAVVNAASVGKVTFHSRSTNGGTPNRLLYMAFLNGTFTPAATTVAAVSATSQEAPVGTAVSEPPSVIVRDQNGDPMAGVTVAFAVTSGGGSISPASAVTGSNGVATANSWTLGPAAGGNSASATVSGLTAVVFNATGTSTGSGEDPPTGGPIASFTVSCGNSFTCSFDASGSTAAAGSTYQWSFGDGTGASGVTTSKVFLARSSNSVTLTVTETGGASDSAQQTVTCNPKKCQ